MRVPVAFGTLRLLLVLILLHSSEISLLVIFVSRNHNRPIRPTLLPFLFPFLFCLWVELSGYLFTRLIFTRPIRNMSSAERGLILSLSVIPRASPHLFEPGFLIYNVQIRTTVIKTLGSGEKQRWTLTLALQCRLQQFVAASSVKCGCE